MPPMAADPNLDTSSQRPPTGMDYGARILIIGSDPARKDRDRAQILGGGVRERQ